jgi:hypothetical protein
MLPPSRRLAVQLRDSVDEVAAEVKPALVTVDSGYEIVASLRGWRQFYNVPN